jgi:hypothetical protein
VNKLFLLLKLLTKNLPVSISNRPKSGPNSEKYKTFISHQKLSKAGKAPVGLHLTPKGEYFKASKAPVGLKEADYLRIEVSPKGAGSRLRQARHL